MFGLKYLAAKNFFNMDGNSIEKSSHPLLCFPAKKNIVQLLQTLKNHHYETFRHSVNVARLSFLLSKEIGLSQDSILAATIGGLLHDIGKIKIDPVILDKSNRLTNEEWHLIKQHPLNGVTILSSFSWSAKIMYIIACHHERIDGKGYLGLKGSKIPLEAKIISIVDAFDAMKSYRPYQQPLSMEESFAELRSNSGTQFDPGLAQTLIVILQNKK